MKTKLLLAFIAGAATAVQAQVIWLTPYRQFADSPFAPISFSSFSLEDFEGVFAPSFSYTRGWYRTRGHPWTDSVDADDGVIDGSGLGGKSFYSGGNSVLEITFDSSASGGLPTHAGLVWTDVGYSTPTIGYGVPHFYAYDAEGYAFTHFYPVREFGDGVVTGETAEDAFFGVSHPVGISKIILSMPTSSDWEVDHIQFGVASSAVPEASTTGVGAALALGGLAALRARYRRRCP